MGNCNFDPILFRQTIGDIFYDADDYGENIEDTNRKITELLSSSKVEVGFNIEEAVSIILLEAKLNDYKDNMFISTEHLTVLINNLGKKGYLDLSKTDTERLVDADVVKNRVDASKAFLVDSYLGAVKVRERAELEVRVGLVKSLFIDRDKGTITDDVGKLNDNLRAYLQELFDKIIKFLKTLNLDLIDKETLALIEDGVMYKGKEYTGIFEALLPLIKRHLSSSRFNTEFINSLYDLSIKASDLSSREQAKTLLDAYNAYVFLSNFDTYILITYNKVIFIENFNERQSGNKYFFRDNYSLIFSTFRTKDPDVELETDTITKEIIETTPVYLDGTDVKKEGVYMTFQLFNKVLTQVKSLSSTKEAAELIFNDEFIEANELFYNSLSDSTKEIIKDKSLADIIDSVRHLASEHLLALSEILNHRYFRDNYKLKFFNPKKFDSSLLDILYSINKELILKLFQICKTRTRFNYFNNIIGLFNTVYERSSIQAYSEKGKPVLRELSDLGIFNILKKIINRINNSNSLRKSNVVLSTIDFTQNPKNLRELQTIKFEIPFTDGLFATVNPQLDYKVTFTRNGRELKDLSELIDNQDLFNHLEEVLKLGFLDPLLVLTLLNNENNSLNKVMEKLLKFYSTVASNIYISSLLKAKSPAEIKSEIASLFGLNNKIRYDSTLLVINLCPTQYNTYYKELAEVKANLVGLTSSVLVKDSLQASLSRLTLSCLAGSIRSLWLLEKLPNSATSDFILFLPGLLKNVHNAVEYYSLEDGKQKSFTDLTAAEMSYLSVMSGFLPVFVQSKEGLASLKGISKNGTALFLMSVNSDKTFIDWGEFDLHTLIDYKGKKFRLIDLDDDQLISLISDQFGTYYTRMLLKIELRSKDIVRVPNEAGDIIELEYSRINDKLREYLRWLGIGDYNFLGDYIRETFPDFPGFDYIHNFEEFNRWFLALNLPDKTPVDFIKRMCFNYNKVHRTNPIALTDLMHLVDNKGIPGNNSIILSLIAKFNPDYLEISDDFKNLFWKKQELEMLKSLLNMKAQFPIDSKDPNDPIQAILESKYKEWVDDSNSLVLATIDGHKISNIYDLYSIFPDKSITSILEEYPIVINPIFKRYNLLHFLLTLEWLDAGVGTFAEHPKGAKTSMSVQEFLYDNTDELSDILLETEAVKFLALHKRNVSWSALMHEFLIDELTSIPAEYNIAVIEDIEELVHVLGSRNNSINPMDGATYSNPFISFLENLSLPGATSKSLVKKPFCHFKNIAAGTAGIIKTAEFPLTNNTIRNSFLDRRLIKKMTNHQYIDEDGNYLDLDISINYKGEKISYADTYFKRDGILYKQVGNFTKVETIQNSDGTLKTLYSRLIAKVNKLGDAIGKAITETVSINSNYDLWLALGGYNSMSIKNGELTLSEHSIELVARAMNEVGFLRKKSDGNQYTLDEVISLRLVYQPLKHSDIHYLATLGSMKHGPANINSVNKYFTDENDLDFFKVKLLQFGIQLDKEHSADDSEVSLMTLVMSACAALGYTYDRANSLYTMLSRLAELGCKNFIKSVEVFNTTKKVDKLKEELVKIMLKNLANPDGNSFAELLAYDIKKKVQELNTYEDANLPISDNAVFNKAVSALSSFITNSSIKLKIPGTLAVMNPSYKRMRVWTDINGRTRKLSNFENESDILKLLEELNANPIYHKELESRDDNLVSLEMGRDYTITMDSDTYDLFEYCKYTFGSNSFGGLPVLYVSDGSLEGLPFIFKDNIFYIDPLAIREEYLSLLDQDPDTSFDEYIQFLLLYVINSMYNSIEENETEEAYHNRIAEITVFQANLLTNKYLLDLYKNDGKQIITLTPEYYYFLKEAVPNNIIYSISEYMLEGRDLGTYNIRFSDSDRVRHLLWELLSIKLGHELDEIIRESKGNITLRDALFNEWLSKNGLSYNSFDDAFVAILTWQKRDYETLSESVESKRLLFERITRDYIESLRVILNINPDRAPAQYKKAEGIVKETKAKFAYWCKVNLTTDEYNDVQAIKKLNDKIDYIRKSRTLRNLILLIDGSIVEVDKDTVEQLPYEVIMPKRFINQFNLKENTDLSEIALDEDWFVKEAIVNNTVKVSSNQYDVVLKNTDGLHYYLLSEEHFTGNLELANDPTIELDGKLYAYDPNADKLLFEILPGSKIYKDIKGNRVIVVSSSEEKSSIDIMRDYMQSLKYSTISVSYENLKNDSAFTEELINVLKTGRLGKLLSRIGINRKGKSITTELILKRFVELDNITIDNYKLKLNENHPIIIRGRSKHSSFLKSLEIVAARIPALNMASFMGMKVVVFEDPDINNAYVSTLLVFLQGSDYDIDAVTLWTYDIARHGILEIWSPYANLETLYMTNLSMELPLPTGLELKLVESSDEELIKLPVAYYRELFLFDKDGNFLFLPNVSGHHWKLLKRFLELESMYIPDEASRYKILNDLAEDGLIPNADTDIFALLKEAYDEHHMYLDNLDEHTLGTVARNYMMYQTFKISTDIVNLLLGQQSVDVVTIPFKEKAKTSPITENSRYRTSGNAFNLMESILETLEGKDCIAKSASAIKGFFTLYHYYNTILNGNKKDSVNLTTVKLLRLIGTLGLLANIRAKDPSTITNLEVVTLLTSVKTTEDVVASLSALLGLSADNAKELVLAKLNAGVDMIGLYLYGISMGKNFTEITDLMMSETATTLKELTLGNIFTTRGYGKVLNAFNYFDSFSFQNKYEEILTSSGAKGFILSYINDLRTLMRLKFKKNNVSLYDIITKLPTNLVIDILENVRNNIVQNSVLTKELKVNIYRVFNFLKHFTIDYHRINGRHFLQLLGIARGANEMARIGLIAGLNKGIPGKSSEAFKKISLIEDALLTIYEEYAKRLPPKERKAFRAVAELNGIEKIDLNKFVKDSTYREKMIKIYDRYKFLFNLLDVVANIPHLFSYVKLLASYDLGLLKTSFRYRSIKKDSYRLKKMYGSSDEEITKGISVLCQKVLIDKWMLMESIKINIPKGNIIFDPNTLKPSEKPSTKMLTIQLGYPHSNATFRVWMEQNFIPELKKGYINGVYFEDLKNNPFIRDLQGDIRTNTVLGDPSVIETLPINMLPRSNAEKTLFDSYLDNFNRLSKFTYNSKNTKVPLVDLLLYYTMIAHGWKLSENSLMPVFTELRTQGSMRSYLDFIKRMDNSKMALSDYVDVDEYIPSYIASHKLSDSSKLHIIKKDDKRHVAYVKSLALIEMERRENWEAGIDEYVSRYLFLYTANNLDRNYFETDEVLSYGSNVLISDGDIKGNVVIKENKVVLVTAVINGAMEDITDLVTVKTRVFMGKPLINELDVINLIREIISRRNKECF